MKIIFFIFFIVTASFAKMFISLGANKMMVWDKNTYTVYWDKSNSRDFPIYAQKFNKTIPSIKIGTIYQYNRNYFSFEYFSDSTNESKPVGTYYTGIEEVTPQIAGSKLSQVDMLIVKLSSDAMLKLYKDLFFYTGVSFAIADITKSTDKYTYYAKLKNNQNENHQYGRIMLGLGIQTGFLYNITNSIDFELGLSYLFLAGYRRVGVISDSIKIDGEDTQSLGTSYVFKNQHIITPTISIGFRF